MYYNLIKIEEEEAKTTPIDVYTDGEKFYYLNSGDMISTLAPDGKTILKNTEIEGVISARTVASAIKKLGVKLVEKDASEE